MEKNFVVEKDGTTLNVILCPELNEETTSAVVDEMLKYYGQGIERVVFNATALVKLERIGLRTIYYAHAKLGSQPEPEIVFVNCEPEIKKVFNYVELDHIVKFEEQQEAKKTYRRVILKDVDAETIGKQAKEKRQILDNFEAHNDIVCYSIKLGKDD